MTLWNRLSIRRKLSALVAVPIAVALGLGAYAITASGSRNGTPANSATATSGIPPHGTSEIGFARDSGSNARSGPAAGGTTGTIVSISASGFTLKTSTGQNVTVKETSSTTYESAKKSASPTAITKGKPALVLGTTDSTTITASLVDVRPPSTGPAPAWAGTVSAFQRGSRSASKSVGKIPASYKQGSGTIVSGTAANQATQAALAVYPGGIVDRVVRLSNGDYEVHYIGVNWPHHIFVNHTFTVIGAN